MEKKIKTLTLSILLLCITTIASTFNARLNNLNLSMLKAINTGNYSRVLMALNQGANVNAKYNHGYTPLHHAVKQGSYNIVNLLITRGAHINARNTYGQTPLHSIAGYYGRDKIVKILLNKGADVNAVINKPGQGIGGQTPLHISAYRGNYNVSRMLIEKGADVNAKISGGVNNGMTPLHMLCWSNFNIKERFLIAKLLIARGANVHLKGGYNLATPLHKAAFFGLDKITRLLISKRVNVNAKKKDGYTPLHNAAMNGRYNVVRILISRGANVNARNKYGRTPIFLAGMSGHRKVIRYLVIKGAKLNIVDKKGKTPLDITPDRRAYDLLKRYGARHSRNFRRTGS